jgi:hypothetical protein
VSTAIKIACIARIRPTTIFQVRSCPSFRSTDWAFAMLSSFIEPTEYLLIYYLSEYPKSRRAVRIIWEIAYTKFGLCLSSPSATAFYLFNPNKFTNGLNNTCSYEKIWYKDAAKRILRIIIK